MNASAALKLRHFEDEVVAVNEDRFFVLHNVSWKEYVGVRRLLDDHAGLRMTYLEGVLEIMSPSVEHERIKKLTARLVEAYAEERDLRLDGYGQATFKKKAKKRGLEPDECYWFGPQRGDHPDLAIEIVLTSGTIDRLEVYRGLGVPEVWFWIEGRYQIWQLGPRGYTESPRSRFLPELDPALLARYVRRLDQTAAVKAFRRAIRK